jgi:hypothetical protein
MAGRPAINSKGPPTTRTVRAFMIFTFLIIEAELNPTLTAAGKGRQPRNVPRFSGLTRTAPAEGERVN